MITFNEEVQEFLNTITDVYFENNTKINQANNPSDFVDATNPEKYIFTTNKIIYQLEDILGSKVNSKAASSLLKIKERIKENIEQLAEHWYFIAILNES